MHVRVYRLYQINLISAPSHLMSDDTSCTWYLHDVMVRYQQLFCLNLVRSHLMSGEYNKSTFILFSA